MTNKLGRDHPIGVNDELRGRTMTTPLQPRILHDPIPDKFKGEYIIAVTQMDAQMGVIGGRSAHEVETTIGEHIALFSGKLGHDYQVHRRFYGINLEALRIVEDAARKMERGESVNLATLLQQ